MLDVSLTPTPHWCQGASKSKQNSGAVFLTVLRKVGYFLKPVMAFFLHEKKVSPHPLGNSFLQFKKR